MIHTSVHVISEHVCVYIYRYIYILYIYGVYPCLMHLYPPRFVVKNETTLQSAEHVTNQEPAKLCRVPQKHTSSAKKTHMKILTV